MLLDRTRLAEMIAAADAVLFDFDGVLANSEPVFFAACRDAFASIGHHLPEAVFYERFAGLGLGVAGEVERAGLALDPRGVARLTDAWMAGYRQRCAAGEARFFPGALGALARVAAVRPTAIASSSTPEQLRGVIEAAGVTPPCPVFGRASGLRKKPAPDVFAYAAGALGAVPARCLVIEDSAKGVAAALAVGMSVVAVEGPWTHTPPFAGAAVVPRAELYAVAPA